jgi:hypothetical protein
LNWYYSCASEVVPYRPKMKDELLSNSVNKSIEKLILRNLEELKKPVEKRHVEVTHIVTTPLNDKILVTVVSRGRIED